MQEETSFGGHHRHLEKYGGHSDKGGFWRDGGKDA